MKADLYNAGFLIAQEPATFSPRRREEKRDAANVVLTSTVYDELADKGLTRIVIVTGDGDFLMLVNALLDKWNVSVRLISGDQTSRARGYLALAGQKRAVAVANGLQPHEASFDTLLLSDLLSSKVPKTCVTWADALHLEAVQRHLLRPVIRHTRDSRFGSAERPRSSLENSYGRYRAGPSLRQGLAELISLGKNTDNQGKDIGGQMVALARAGAKRPPLADLADLTLRSAIARSKRGATMGRKRPA